MAGEMGPSWPVPGVPPSKEEGLGSLKEDPPGMWNVAALGSPPATAPCLPRDSESPAAWHLLSHTGERARSAISPILWLRRLASRNVQGFLPGGILQTTFLADPDLKPSPLCCLPTPGPLPGPEGALLPEYTIQDAVFPQWGCVWPSLPHG